MVAATNTIVDIAMYGGSLSTADLQQCYKCANLAEGKLLN